ncbi:MAG TPA: hypothetical protein DIT04_07820, partial [Dysgonomonas sp.]|nr:hypothetical protein [Dysgonomonas sp.]
MEDYDFDVTAAFVYYKEHEEDIPLICDKIPPASPQRGDEEYYVWRFNNFMERHLQDCSHEPPVYYYGTLIDPATVLKKKTDSNTNKNWWENAKDKVEEAWDNTNLNPKQMWLGLDKTLKEKQQNAKQYIKNDETVIPNISKSYGYKYCLAFGKLLKPKLSPAGQIWVTKTLDYLQEYMEAGLVDLDWESEYSEKFKQTYDLSDKSLKVKFYTNIELNNAKFKAFAFATHPDAYINANIGIRKIGDICIDV